MASAAILAGGRAIRFGGRDKSAIVVNGESILTRQIAALSTLTDDILLVGRRHDDAGPDGVRLVADQIADAGPLGGLDAALSAARDEPLVLLACDMPFPDPALLAYMIELAGTADIVVPLTERGYHPLCAVYTRACKRPLTERLRRCSEPGFDRRLNKRELRMTGLFEDVRVRTIETAELERFGDTARLFANVNTPAEYYELEALLGHKL
jgi:molybdopterin-guanine dinucleotide biosynthesis protein A